MLLVVLAALAVNAHADELALADFEGDGYAWRSKFSSHVVREIEGGHALEVPYDFRTGPKYLWARVMCDPPVDARGYAYLSFRVKGDNSGQHVTPVLINTETVDGRTSEIVRSAHTRVVVLDFEGWREFSVPMAAFGADEPMLAALEQVSFGLNPKDAAPAPRSLWLDDVKLVGPDPVGEVIEESVPFPPADIAITSDEAMLGAMDLDRPELAQVKAAAVRGDIAGAKAAWAEHLETRTEPRWLWSRFEREEIIETCDARFGGLARYSQAADRALARDFNWLGVRKQLDHDIEWLQGTVEWTHVLSRFGYWGDMGKAYWGTGEAKYAEDFVFTLRDWIADNPVPRLVSNRRGTNGNVWRTLEAGIRGDVWFDVMELFMHAPEFDAQAKWEMTRSLVEHARYLHRYETVFRHGNWQVVECTGLAFVGIMLPEFRQAEEWRERGLDCLVQHMERDVYADGAHYEVTPGYHSWVMQLFLKAALLAERNGYEIPGLMEKHERMFEFLMKVSRPNGRAPSLGDGGGPGGHGIHGNVALGALVYDRPDMRFLGVDEPQEQWVWLLGRDAIERYDDMASEPPAFTSTYLPEALYYTMRTGWEPEDAFLLFDCAPWGGGHSHADRLSICVYQGEDLILDPGMYSYDQPLSRTYLRFGEAHNVLLVDGEEQPSADPIALAHSFGGEFESVYGRLIDETRGIVQTRGVVFAKPDYWVLSDHVTGEGAHHLEQRFHLPLKAQVEATGARCVVTLKSGKRFIVEGVGGTEARIVEGWIPTGGATAEKAPVIALEAETELPAALGVLIYPTEDPSGVSVELLEATEGQTLAVKVTAPGREDVIAFADHPAE